MQLLEELAKTMGVSDSIGNGSEPHPEPTDKPSDESGPGLFKKFFGGE